MLGTCAVCAVPGDVECSRVVDVQEHAGEMLTPNPTSVIMFELKSASLIASAAAAISASIVGIAFRLWDPVFKSHRGLTP